MSASDTPSAPLVTDCCDAAVDAVLKRVGNTIVLGIPLGLGKPGAFVNALYARAKADPTIRLTIFTALTLARPRASGVAGAFLAPMVERVMGGYTELDYYHDRNRGSLPANVTVREFFFQAGSQLGNADAQQHYISSNYTHVARDMIDHGANVFAQLVASHPDGRDDIYSLSCNPDVSLEVVPMARARWPIAVVGQISADLPYMPGDSEQAATDFDVIVDQQSRPADLFAVPKQPVSLADHAIGLHASALLADGGTIQLGIGALGDAVAHALVLRHTRNTIWRDLVGPSTALRQAIGGDQRFDIGLYGATEMFVDGFMALYQAGILSRRVVDDIDQQTAINNGQPPPADGSHVLHGGFFLGPRCFYDAIDAMSLRERASFQMTAVRRINQLYGSEQLDRLQRTQARFINTGLKCTLSGAVVSDALDNHRVLSGVGGQYNFVSQAHALDGGRSVLLIKAVRGTGADAESNIVWEYAHTTIPRHLRDIIVTEYGTADLRGASDRDVIVRLLAVTDSRFQDKLLTRAKRAGKVESDYQIPQAQRGNTPDALAQRLLPARRAGHLPHFPLPTDWTPLEQRLAVALSALRDVQSSHGRAALAWRAWRSGPPDVSSAQALYRVGLDAPTSLTDRMAARLLARELRESADTFTGDGG